MTLRERWDHLSKHPTWATVIGGLILAGILTTLAQIWSLVRAVAEAPPGQITTQLGAAWHWLSADVPIPRGVALVLTAIVLALLSTLARYWLAVVRTKQKLAHVAVSIKEATTNLQRETEEAAARFAREAEARGPEVKDLGDPEKRLLYHLFAIYPRYMGMPDIIDTMQVPYAPAERLLEKLQAWSLLEFDINGREVCLTKTGRDFCDDHKDEIRLL